MSEGSVSEGPVSEGATLAGAARAAAIAPALLAHYDAHARSFPWRLPPGSAETPDPYRIWLSEVMLQQTTVAAVVPYFEHFTGRWPDVAALAHADESAVMAAWAGLGYYARARNLIACARQVADERGGRFPDEEEGLRALPGVGAYTAAAIAAIAFGRRAVVVDANVERVVSRLFAIETPLPQARPEIRAATDAITPERRAGDFAQAMMDLGAGICTVKAPQCLICPLRPHCAAAALGRGADFPVKPPKKARPERRGRVWWLEREDGHVWIVRRAEKRMLGGMTGLPDTAWDARGGAQSDSARGGAQTDKRRAGVPADRARGDMVATGWDAGGPPVPGAWVALNRPVAHVFTHFRLELTVERLVVERGCVPEGEGQWWPLGRIDAAGLPTLFAKVAAVARRVPPPAEQQQELPAERQLETPLVRPRTLSAAKGSTRK